MKILHLISNRWNSAITEYAVRCAQSLLKTQHHQVVFCLEKSPAAKRFKELKIEVKELKNFNPRLYSFFQIRKTKSDLVFTYGGQEEFLAHITNHQHIIRFIGEDRKQNKIRHFLSHIKTRRLITPSNAIAEKIKGIDPYPERVISIPLGLDVQNLHTFTQKKQHPPYLLIFGRLDPVKGHKEFLEIFAQSFKFGMPKNTILKIIGEEKNTTANEIIKKSNDLNIAQNVVITTKIIENKNEIMRNAVVGVVSSLGSEVICRVAQEFLMCGCPVLTSGVGSLEETLIEKDFGASWKHIPHHERAMFIADYFHKYQQENLETRNERARQAQENFSLEKFSERILKSLQ